MKDDRNWNDPQYRDWRLAVYKRDGFTCQMPGCGRKGFSAKIQAHHIKKWATFPELRFQLTNGITLCKRCHSNLESQEEAYEAIFIQIVNKKINPPIKPSKQSKKNKEASDAAFEAKRFLYSDSGDGSLSC